jgi:methylase of polypeptide subunit release factors
MIEATLESVKKSKAYPDIESKIRSGIYRTNRVTRNLNRAYLEKTKLRLTKKLATEKSTQVKGDRSKIVKIDTLLPIIDDETNVENTNVGNLQEYNSNNESAQELELAPMEQVVAPVTGKEEILENENAIAELINLEGIPSDGENLPVGENVRSDESLQIEKKDCNELFDPCTRKPIENGDIDILERRVRDIKKQRLVDVSNKLVFPEHIKNRLDLLLFILNRNEKPNETLLQYNINGQLYESYWDIVFTLGLMDTFPITKDFRMFNGKIETLTNIDGEEFSNSPLTYLQSKKVNEGSKSGASDITFVYKKNKSDLDIDICSSDPSIKVLQTCDKNPIISKVIKKDRPQFFFCSSKYFNKDSSKGVDKFDIQNIYTAAKSLDQEYDRKIILLVKDKGAVEEKLRKAIRKYISEEASYVYGIDDLFTSLTSLYDYIHNKHKSEEKLTGEMLNNIMKLESPPKPILRLRLHQYLATYKICDAIKRFSITRINNKFLVGIVPRGGKTFIAGGIIDTLNPKRVVVLLGAKSETLSQFKKDLFEEFQNFKHYECIDVVDTTDMAIDSSKKYIFIMSVELYKQVDSTRRLLQELKGGANRADLFICDEAHLKQTTARAVKQMEKGTVTLKVEEEEEDVSEEAEKSQLKELDKQIHADVPVVYMTGTYIKPLKAFNIPDENVVIWDYQDIQQAKELSSNEEYFKENFGELYDRSLKTCISYGQTYETIQQQYQKFPELYLLTTQFTDDAKSAFLQQTKGGFPTISHLFEVRVDFNPETTPPERWYTGFTNPKGMIRLLNYLAPPTKQLEEIDGIAVEPISSVLRSVDSIAQRIGDRLGFFTSEFVVHSQLWFLPHMQKNPLYKRMCALAGAIFQSSWFRKYFHIIGVSSSVKWNIPGSEQNSILVKATDGSDSCGTFSWACPTGDKSLKECLLDQEAVARRKGKGLIILAQNMLHLGISLPCVDIVVLLDVGEKVDERIQKMYRALTESTNKKGGYIIDMNYFRTVTAIMNYQITAEKMRKGKKEVYAGDIPKLFNKVLDIFSIDDDKHILRADIVKETLPELQKLIETGKRAGDSIMLEDAGSALNTNIKTVMEKAYKSSYDEFLGLLKEEEFKQKQLRAEGKNVVQAEHNEELDEGDKEPSYPEPKIFREGTTEEQRKEAYIDIFKTTLKLGAFGTNSNDVKALEEKLSMDKEFRQTLYDTLIKRGAIPEDKVNTDLQSNFIIDIMIRPGLIKMIDEGRNGSYYKMKESIEDEEKYPVHVEKVLDYIKNHLTPKSAERHKYGEVFTPMSLVNEMLDTLPSEVWANKTLKWLDPANGMGNFPIGVFLRLFYGFRTKSGKYVGITNEGEGDYNPGLTEVINNEDLRRKHIVKDMLYMVELNSKNNAIAKNLFKKLAPDVDPNIIQMHRTNGFLADIEMKFPNGVVKEFDIVMGNPPYNSGSTRAMATNETRKARAEIGVTDEKHKNLWIPFTNKSLDILKKDGYLLFIMPIGWFKPDRTGIYQRMLSHQIHKIRIIFNSDAKRIFGGSGEINVAYFLLENKETTQPTQILDIYNNKDIIQLKPDSILSLAYNSIFIKVQNKSVLFKDSEGYYTSAIASAKCRAGKNKQVHRITNDGDITYIKTDITHQKQNVPKIILSGAKYPRFLYDNTGEYGVIGTHQHYFIGEDLDKIEKYFNTKLSALLLANIKYDMKYIDPKYYPDVRTLPLEKITDETLAGYFGFTKEEREAINATEYPKREYKFKEITCAQLKGEKAEAGDSDAEGGGRPRRFTRKVRRV